NAQDTDEHGTAVCDDGADNDLDATSDYKLTGGDLGCASLTDTNERGASVCDNGADDDNDGRTDFSTDSNLNDPGCSGPTDTTEKCAAGAGCPQCDDSADNDNDGLSDYNLNATVADPGCSGVTDNDERGGTLVCDNGNDDDTDGTRDFRLDGTGDICCTSLNTSTEACACATKIAGGTEHTCAIKGSGLTFCWGDNANGQLGNNSTNDSHVPVQVTATNLSVAVQVAAGDRHTCARKQDNKVYCWGLNTSGQVGDASNTQRTNPTAVSATNLTAATDVATGLNHSCAVKTDGTVWCWGKNDSGQLGNNSQTNSNVPVQVQGLPALTTATATDVAAGEAHSCARLSNGTVWCWGKNDVGQLADNTNTMRLIAVQSLKPKSGPAVFQPITSASAVVTGKNHSCALLSGGGVQCWGEGSNGQLGNSASNDAKLAVNVSNLADAADLVAGQDHTCAKRSGGTEVCWGTNTSGQLGDHTSTNRNAPVTVQLATNGSPMSGVSAIGAGGAHSCALTSTVTAECWGSNTQGQLGDNTIVPKDQASPVSITCP
ncbi:MAG TPA: hypothetical protein VL326_22705, partial [Kofleriaceae bacterium]|nr:hypothetical protein [Kofleriaceae bacterium]